ncbi:MAG: TetR/AcrR family transcriptional regulator [Syntrophomonadaceae bacterium]|nr:TetR/AcrR family transcriptional regulator [Syntrophomonadaceae bacterium]
MQDSSSRVKKKKEEIIRAAIQVFSSKGYHNTRMEEIAAAAGIGKGTIYEYFDSKLQLFQEMLKNSLQIYYKNLDGREMKNLSVAEKIYMLMEAHFRFCRENKELTRIVFWETGTIDEELKEWVYAMRDEKEKRMQEIITEGISRGEIRNLDPRLVTLVVIGILGATWIPLALEKWEIDPAFLAKQFTDILVNGIKKEKLV